MATNYYDNSSSGMKAAATLGVIMLVIGVFILSTLQPSSLEQGSGMGNYKIPGSSHRGQTWTSPATTSGSGTGTAPSAGNIVPPPPTLVDVNAPINDTANN